MNKRALILLLSIAAMALVLRLAGIQSRPIWYDEAFSILLAQQGPSAILNGTLATDTNASAAEEHPPAYYFALWGWMQLFGNSLTSARLLSVLFSLGTITLVYLITNHLFNPSTAWVAALFTSILPFQVHFGVEIRMYMMLAFWLTLATYTLLKRQWILFSLAAALAQYTHNLAAIYLIPLALTPVFQRDWKTLRSLTLAGVGSLILYSPWLMQLPAQISKVTSSFWVEKPGIEKIFTLILMYLPHLPLPGYLLPVGLLFATLVIALAAFQTYRARKDISGNSNKGLWLAYLSFAPPLFLWMVSQISPIYVERALLPAHAIFCIWLAWAFTQTKLPQPVQVFTLCLILIASGMGVYQHITYRGFPYTSPALTQNLNSKLQQGDVVIHSSKLSYLPAFYFSPELPQIFIADPANSSVDTLSPATQKILNLKSIESIESGAENSDRIWFIIYQQSIEEFSQAGKNHPHLEYLDQNFELEMFEKWGDLNLYLYKRSSE
ncbi:MAG: glycosyltransferase family 39 protein [Anaerolineae bacterium]|nr:glycosyltransferase family 39 protein [Anaerolineae bacterium]